MAQAKRLLLDTLAVAWAGGGADGIDSLRALVLRQGGATESGLWSFGERVPAVQAAFFNGAMAAALDFDSVHDEATVHADIVVLPAVLALAERGELDARSFIAAHVAGDEILVRLGLAVQKHPGWFYTSALGVFAAAAASARALKMDARGIQAAMGIALSRAAGTQQALVERALTKRLQSAFAARDGVDCALLAESGVTSPAAAFDGQCGFETLYTGLDHAKVLDGLGREFQFSSLTLKKYPSCFCNHAAIEAAFSLHEKYQFKIEELENISVVISPFMQRLVGAPFAPGDNPQVAAQFSIQYSIASALLRKRFSAEDIQPAAVLDPVVGALAARVRVEVDPAQSGKFVPATVALRMRNGRELAATATQIPGTPALPMSEAELHAKAMACFTGGARPMSTGAAERFIAKIDRLESIPSLRNFWEVQ